MPTRTFGYLCLLAFVCMFLDTGVAQTPADHARFAIEFPGFSGPFPYYLTIPEAASPSASPCSTFSYGHALTRLSNAGTGVEPPSALRLEICIKGDTVLITPTVFYGAYNYDHDGLHNPPYEKLRPQTLATHSGKLNDTVTFTEMKEVGLEPLTLRIVSAHPENLYHPLTRSDVPSVQIEYAPVDRTFGTLTLHNSSIKAVNAFRVDYSGETGLVGALEQDKGGLCSLIAPGSSHQARIDASHSGKTVGGTFVEDPQPKYMTLQSVLFADGSYEGNQRTAADMAAREFGAHVQLVRIEQLAEPILAEEGLDDAAKMGRIRSAILQLSAQADPAIIFQFHAQYPAFSEDFLEDAERNIGNAMKDENSLMDHTLQENEPMLRQGRTSHPLAQMWTAMTQCR